MAASVTDEIARRLTQSQTTEFDITPQIWHAVHNHFKILLTGLIYDPFARCEYLKCASVGCFEHMYVPVCLYRMELMKPLWVR